MAGLVSMAASKGLLLWSTTTTPGLSPSLTLTSKPPSLLAFHNTRAATTTPNTSSATISKSKKVFLAQNRYCTPRRRRLSPIYATPLDSTNHQNIKLSSGYNEEPFYLQYFKQGISAIKMVLLFLIEQPSQVKYIEWPSFGSTLKTSALALILVALLIVALSTVDSVLSFLLALILRKTA